MAEYSVRYRIGVDTGDSSEKLDKVAKGAENVDNKMGKVAKGNTSSATIALNNVNRVIQDAPYGFIGIANNIDPLLASYQKLKLETGSTGGAFKALAGTLTGPMGVLFGMSALVAIVQVLPGILQKTIGATQHLNKEMAQAGVSARSQQIQIEALSGSLTNNKYSMEQRKSLLKEIQKINPEYLKNINIEKTSFKDLSLKINDANKALEIKTNLTIIYAQIAALAKKAADMEADIMTELPDTADWIVALLQSAVSPGQNSMLYNAMGVSTRRRLGQLDKINKRITQLSTKAAGLSYSGFSGGSEDIKTPSGKGANEESEFDKFIKQSQMYLQIAEQKNLSLAETSTQLDQLAKWHSKLKPWSDDELKYLQYRNELYQKYLSLSGGKPEELDILAGINTSRQLRTNDLLPSLQGTGKIAFDPLSYAKGNPLENWTKFHFFLERSIDLSASLRRGFDRAGDSLSTALSNGLNMFGQVNSLLEIFIDGLVRATFQSIALAAINNLLGFLGGSIPFLSFLAPSGAATGGGNSPIFRNTAELLKAANSAQRQTMNVGGTVSFKASGRDLKATITAEELFRATQR